MRARTVRQAAPESIRCAMPGPRNTLLAQMPDVYAPAGAIVEPPRCASACAVRSSAIEPRAVMWLARTLPNGKFRVERIADDEFMPLSEWADYIDPCRRAGVVPWIRAWCSTSRHSCRRGSNGRASARRRTPRIQKEDNTKRRGRGGSAVADEPETRARRPDQSLPTMKRAETLGRQRRPHCTRRGSMPSSRRSKRSSSRSTLAEAMHAERMSRCSDRLSHVTTHASPDRRRDAGLCLRARVGIASRRSAVAARHLDRRRSAHHHTGEGARQGARAIDAQRRRRPDRRGAHCTCGPGGRQGSPSRHAVARRSRRRARRTLAVAVAARSRGTRRRRSAAARARTRSDPDAPRRQEHPTRREAAHSCGSPAAAAHSATPAASCSRTRSRSSASGSRRRAASDRHSKPPRH